ncbi:hypothetical protein B4144_1806 [Bacillus atrophaeus]|nr:hypothetical protein B4144_1806 [Bacillus atrophaeus]
MKNGKTTFHLVKWGWKASSVRRRSALVHKRESPSETKT